MAATLTKKPNAFTIWLLKNALSQPWDIFCFMLILMCLLTLITELLSDSETGCVSSEQAHCLTEFL